MNAIKDFDNLGLSFIKNLDICISTSCCQQISIALTHINPVGDVRRRIHKNFKYKIRGSLKIKLELQRLESASS